MTSVSREIKLIFPLIRIPIPLCRILGNTTAEYRWFAIAYLVVMFLVVPGITCALSLNTILFLVVLIPFALTMIFVVIVNIMQRKEGGRKYLPEVLKNWDFLPEFLRSLDPYDR